MQNQKRYWLRGGIIALVSGPIIFVFMIISTMSHSGGDLVNLVANLFFYIPLKISSALFGKSYLGIILIGIYDFIFGAIIGIVYGKIKKRKIPNDQAIR